MFRKGEPQSHTTPKILRGEKRDLKQMEVSVMRSNCEFLKALFKGYKRFPSLEIYIHGSWADNTKTSFSDFDDLIIVHDGDFSTTSERKELDKWLNKVDMRFCRMDPLQHHGHWIIWESELNNYDESYMPMSVLANGLVLQGRHRIFYSVDTLLSRHGLLRNIDFTLRNIEVLMLRYFDNKINAYDLKCLIGSILLMPAYLYQSQGVDLSKREAIESSNVIFSTDAFEVIRKASYMRSNWDRVFKSSRMIPLKLFSKICTNPHIFRKVSKKISPVVSSNTFPVWHKEEVDNYIKISREYVCAK